MAESAQTDKDLEEIVEAAVARLAEHFEAIEILCSRVSEGGDSTQSIKRGAGNWYARQGMAQEFIGLTRADEIAERINLNAGE